MLIEQIEVNGPEPSQWALRCLFCCWIWTGLKLTTVGYISGDQCLVQMAKVLKTKVCRPGDFLARFEEQFALLLPATSNTEAKILAADMAAPSPI